VKYVSETVVAEGLVLVEGVCLGILCLARVTVGALFVGETIRQLAAPDITVLLNVRIVTIDACHRAVQVTITVAVVTLIRERPVTTIREERAAA
jgi:hypothetical protein